MKNKITLIGAVSMVLLLTACGGGESKLSGSWVQKDKNTTRYITFTQPDKDGNMFFCKQSKTINKPQEKQDCSKTPMKALCESTNQLIDDSNKKIESDAQQPLKIEGCSAQNGTIYKRTDDKNACTPATPAFGGQLCWTYLSDTDSLTTPTAGNFNRVK